MFMASLMSWSHFMVLHVIIFIFTIFAYHIKVFDISNSIRTTISIIPDFQSDLCILIFTVAAKVSTIFHKYSRRLFLCISLIFSILFSLLLRSYYLFFVCRSLKHKSNKRSSKIAHVNS